MKNARRLNIQIVYQMGCIKFLRKIALIPHQDTLLSCNFFTDEGVVRIKRS